MIDGIPNMVLIVGVYRCIDTSGPSLDVLEDYYTYYLTDTLYYQGCPIYSTMVSLGLNPGWPIIKHENTENFYSQGNITNIGIFLGS